MARTTVRTLGGWLDAFEASYRFMGLMNESARRNKKTKPLSARSLLNLADPEDLLLLPRGKQAPIRRPDQAVRVPFAEIGATAHWAEFRHFLLTLGGKLNEDPPFNAISSRFFMPDYLAANPKERLVHEIGLLSLAAWEQYSRTVYHLRPGMQAGLAHTTLEGVTWEQLQFRNLPFRSFAVELSTPISGPAGQVYDFCILSDLSARAAGGPPVLVFQVYSSLFRDYQPLSPNDYEQLRKRLASKKWRQAESEILHKLLPSALQAGATWTMIIRPHTKNSPPIDPNNPTRIFREELSIDHYSHTDEMVVHTIEQARTQDSELPSEYFTLMDEMLRIVVGTCLLRMNPRVRRAGAPAEGEEQAPPAPLLPPNPRSITDAKDVCVVEHDYPMSYETEVLLGLAGNAAERARVQTLYRLVPGHYRRWPGEGGDPDAPKTVQVAPYAAGVDVQAEGLAPGSLRRL